MSKRRKDRGRDPEEGRGEESAQGTAESRSLGSKIAAGLTSRRTLLAGVLALGVSLVWKKLKKPEIPSRNQAPYPTSLETQTTSIGSEVVKIENQNFEIVGTPEQRKRVHEDLTGALEDLRLIGFPYEPLSSKTSLRIRIDPDYKGQGETVYEPDNFRGDFEQRPDNVFDMYPCAPRALKEIVLSANPWNGRGTLAHELTHARLGYYGNWLWLEGIPEAMKLFSLSRQMPHVDSRSLQEFIVVNRLSLFQHAWNPHTIYEMFTLSHAKKNASFSSDNANRRTKISGLSWYRYIKSNPSFLPWLQQFSRDHFHDPQDMVPTESALIKAGNLFDPQFQAWYESQACFKKPRPGEKIVEGFLDLQGDLIGRSALCLLAGEWKEVVVRDPLDRNTAILDHQCFYPLHVRGKFYDELHRLEFFSYELTPEKNPRNSTYFIIAVPATLFDVEVFDPTQQAWKKILARNDMPF